MKKFIPASMEQYNNCIELLRTFSRALPTFIPLDVGVLLVSGKKRRGTVERALFEDLTMNYDAGTRPVLQASSAVKVNFSISLHQIMDLVRLLILVVHKYIQVHSI